MQAHFPPGPVHPFVVHQTALPPQQAGSDPPAPANMLSRDLSEPTPQLGLLNVKDPAAMALGAAVLAHNRAGEPLDNAGRVQRASTALRRRSGLKSFPQPAPTASQKPAARAWLSPARTLPEAF